MRNTNGPNEALLNLAIVDDHPLMREGLRHALSGWPHGRVVLEAADGVDYEEQCAQAPPIHIVVVDLHMPRRDGYATLGWVSREQPEAMPVALGDDERMDAAQQAMHLGARTFLPKSVAPGEMLNAVESLRTTGYYLNSWVKDLFRRNTPLPKPEALRRKALDLLSARELEFLKHYIKEDEPTFKVIAEWMDVEPTTVETLRKRLADKIGRSGRIATLLFAQRFGLV